MALAQTPAPIVENPREYLTLVHGAPGVGKTSWAAQIEGHYFIKTQEGTSGLKVYGDTCNSWKKFLKIGKDLTEGVENNWKDQRRVEVVIIDTAQLAWEQCGEWLVANTQFMVKGSPQRFENIRHVPFGEGYKETTKEFLRVCNKIKSLGIGVILLSHTNFRQIKWGGEMVDRVEPFFVPSAVTSIVGDCDAVGYFDIDEQVEKKADEISGELKIVKVGHARRQWWQPQFLRVSKHRLEGFSEKLDLPLNKGWQVYEEEFKKRVACLMKSS